MLVNIVFLSKCTSEDVAKDGCVEDIFREIGLTDDNTSFFVTCNGRKVSNDTVLEHGKTYHVIPRLLGGKGGFGSMLRAIGAQIEKTTSREACRDLSGRRMRDINNEKKLKEWLAKEAERERDREQRRKERLERQLKPQHKFDDPEYHEQMAKVHDDLEDALSKGLKRAHKKNGPSDASSSKKLKTSASAGKPKAEWLGVDMDSDEMDSDSDNEAHPGDPDTPSQPEDTVNSEDSTSRVSNVSEENGCSSSTSSSPKSSDKSAVSGHSKDKTDASETSNDTRVHSLLSAMPPPSSSKNSVVHKSEVRDTKADSSNNSDEPVDLNDYNSSVELEELGLERLKNALMSRGLKCGGTLDERAERLFSVKGLIPDQIDPSLFAKSKGKGKKSK